MNPITDYIPQRAPFIMVNGISHRDNQAFAQLEILEDNLFVSDGFFAEPGLLEHMAQSVALLNAAQGSVEMTEALDNSTPKVGYIGAVKNLQIHRLPAIGEVVESSMNVIHNIMNAQIVQMRACVNNEEIATCELKIFVSQ